MGRKIPGRKHRGVRDPEKQAAVRYNSIKDKINAPPSNPDDQQIPRSLQRIIDLKNKVKSGNFGKKRNKNIANENPQKKRKYEGKPEKPVPVFKQKPGETDRAFVRRMNNVCLEVTREAKYEEKYRVEIKRNAEGQIEDVIKRPKDELELLIKKARKEKKEKKLKKQKKKKSDENVDSPKLTKSQKWALKKKQKKLKKKSQNADEFLNYRDEVKFGETVHAPPTLVAPRKVEKSQAAPRPGRKPLLLKSVMQAVGKPQNNKHSSTKSESKLHKINKKVIDKKGKRKDLPNALRRQLENQQKEIIDAYKLLKVKKYENKK